MDRENLETPVLPAEEDIRDKNFEKNEMNRKDKCAEEKIFIPVQNHDHDEKSITKLIVYQQPEIPDVHKYSKHETIKKMDLLCLCTIWIILLTISRYIFRTEWSLPFMTEVNIIQVAFTALFSWLFLLRKNCEKIKPEVFEISYLKYIVPIVLSMSIRTRIKNYMSWISPMDYNLHIRAEALVPFVILGFSKLALEYKSITSTKIFLFGVVETIFIYVRENNRDFFNSLHGEVIVCSTLISLEIIVSKKLLEEKRMHPMRLLVHLSCSTLCLIVPIFIFNVYQRMVWRGDSFSHYNLNAVPVFESFIIEAIMFSGQVAIAFKILSIVTPIRFAIICLIVHVLSAILFIPIRDFYGLDRNAGFYTEF